MGLRAYSFRVSGSLMGLSKRGGSKAGRTLGSARFSLALGHGMGVLRLRVLGCGFRGVSLLSLWAVLGHMLHT